MNPIKNEKPACRSLQSSKLLRDYLLVSVGLLLLLGLVYANSDHEEFLFDSRHGNIKTGDLSGALRDDMHDLLLGFWRPGEDLSRVSFRLNAMVNRAVGLDTFDATGFLVVNVVVHTLNAWLLYLLILRLQRVAGVPEEGFPLVPLAATVWFAIHPLQANSIAYILQRRGTLSSLFFILAVLLFVSARTSARHRYLKIVGVGFCYWLSVKSKFLGLPLPFVLLCVEFCLRAGDRQSLRRYLKFLVPGLVFATVGMFIFAWSRGLFSPTGGIQAYSTGLDWTPWQHLLTESRVFLHYWKLLLLPLPQWMCVDHRIEVSRTVLQHGAGIALLAHLLLLTAAIWLARRGWLMTAIGILWFYVALIPYAVLPTHELFVEYKTYLPSVGLAIIIADLLVRVGGRLGRRPVLAGAATVLVVLSVATISRNRVYQSPLAFWSDAVEKYPDDPRINLSMGYSCWTAGQTEKADFYYRRAITVAPKSGIAHHYYAGYLRKKGDLAGALQQYLSALALPEEFPRQEAHSYAGQLLQASGRTDEAIPHLLKAIDMQSDDVAARFSLGNALAARKDRDAAIAQYQEVLRLAPNWPDALVNLGNVFLESGKPESAIEYYARAVAIKPGDPHSRLNYSYALTDLGRVPEALEQATEAVRLDPTNVHAQAQLKALEAVKPRGN